MSLVTNSQLNNSTIFNDISETAKYVADLVVMPKQEKKLLQMHIEYKLAYITDLRMTQSKKNHIIAMNEMEQLCSYVLNTACAKLEQTPVTIADMAHEPVCIDFLTARFLVDQAKEMGMGSEELDSIIEKVKVISKMIPESFKMQLCRDAVTKGLKELGMDNMGVDINNPATFLNVLPLLYEMHTHGIVAHYKDNPEDFRSLANEADASIKRLHQFAKDRIIDGSADKTSVKWLAWSKKENIMSTVRNVLVSFLALSGGADALGLATLVAGAGAVATIAPYTVEPIQYAYNAWQQLGTPLDTSSHLTIDPTKTFTLSGEQPDYEVPMIKGGVKTWTPFTQDDLLLGACPENSVVMGHRVDGTDTYASFISCDIADHHVGTTSVMIPIKAVKVTEEGQSFFETVKANQLEGKYAPKSLERPLGPNVRNVENRWRRHGDDRTYAYVHAPVGSLKPAGEEREILSYIPKFWTGLMEGLLTAPVRIPNSTSNPLIDPRNPWINEQRASSKHVVRRVALLARVIKIPFTPFSGKFIVPLSTIFFSGERQKKSKLDGVACEDALFNKTIEDKDFVAACKPFLKDFVSYTTDRLLKQHSESGDVTLSFDSFIDTVLDDSAIKENAKAIEAKTNNINSINAKKIEAKKASDQEIKDLETELSGKTQGGYDNAIETVKAKIANARERASAIQEQYEAEIYKLADDIKNGNLGPGSNDFDMVSEISMIVHGFLDANLQQTIGWSTNSLQGNTTEALRSDYIRTVGGFISQHNTSKITDDRMSKFIVNEIYKPKIVTRFNETVNSSNWAMGLSLSGLIISVLSGLCASKGAFGKRAKKRVQHMTIVDSIRPFFMTSARVLPEYDYNAFKKFRSASWDVTKCVLASATADTVFYMLTLDTLRYILGAQQTGMMPSYGIDDPMIAGLVVLMAQFGMKLWDLTSDHRAILMEKLYPTRLTLAGSGLAVPTGYCVDMFHPISPCKFVRHKFYLRDSDECKMSNYMFWECFDDDEYWEELRTLEVKKDKRKNDNDPTTTFIDLDGDSNPNSCEHALYNLFVNKEDLGDVANNKSTTPSTVLCTNILDLLTHLKNAGAAGTNQLPYGGGIMDRLLPWTGMVSPTEPVKLIDELVSTIISTTITLESKSSIYSRCIIFIVENIPYVDRDDFDTRAKKLIINNEVFSRALGWKDGDHGLESMDNFYNIRVKEFLSPKNLDPSAKDQPIYKKLITLVTPQALDKMTTRDVDGWNRSVQNWIEHHQAIIDTCLDVIKLPERTLGGKDEKKEDLSSSNIRERKLQNIKKECKKMKVFLNTLKMLSDLVNSLCPKSEGDKVFSLLQMQVFEGTRKVKGQSLRYSNYSSGLETSITLDLLHNTRLKFANIWVTPDDGEDKGSYGKRKEDLIKATVERNAKILAEMTEVRETVQRSKIGWFFKNQPPPLGKRHFDLRLLFSLVVICAKFEASECCLISDKLEVKTDNSCFMWILNEHFPDDELSNKEVKWDRVRMSIFTDRLKSKVNLIGAIGAVRKCLEENKLKYS